MMQLLIPITRDWTRERVLEAIAASDIPREVVLLVFDAPVDDAAWIDGFAELGFDVHWHHTGRDVPPETMLERRPRHIALRTLTQRLVADELLLCLEDDTLVPLDVWERLSMVGPNVSAVQASRFDPRFVGVWEHQVPMKRWEARSGVEDVQACGLFCLLTTGEAYRRPFSVGERFGGAVDASQTERMRPKVDWSCICGHLTRKGVIMPEQRPVHESGMQMFATESAFTTKARPGGELFRTLGRVERDGHLMAAARDLIPLESAIKWGLADSYGNPLPGALYSAPFSPVGVPIPVEELNADGPTQPDGSVLSLTPDGGLGLAAPGESAPAEAISADVAGRSIAELRAEARALGLNAQGSKVDLAARIAAARG